MYYGRPPLWCGMSQEISKGIFGPKSGSPPAGGQRLCLGGSFNPLHHGHLICARAAAEAGGYGGVRLIVSARPPHKPADAGVAAAADRVALCRAAVAGDDFFLVDDRETRRAGPSFTSDTARELQRETGDTGPVPWLIGADLLAGLTGWHEAELLLSGSLVRFVVMRRAGYAIEWDALPPAVARLRESVVGVPQIDISATRVRERLAGGRDVRYLVPDGAAALIRERGMYRPEPAAR